MCGQSDNTKQIKAFPKQKPWINGEVHLLLKAKDCSLQVWGLEAYSSARATPRRGISQAKYTYRVSKSIKENFNSSDPWHMWQGIQAITDCKSPSTVAPSSSACLPNKPNYFYITGETRRSPSKWISHLVNCHRGNIYP